MYWYTIHILVKITLHSTIEARQSAGKTVNRISDDYLIGFIEGEGCFYVSVVPSKETTTGWQVIHFFKVSQNPRGLLVLQALQERLDCGYIKANASAVSKDKTLAYVVRNITDLNQKVIPFFQDKLVIKQADFDKFCSIIKLVTNKEHLKKEGMTQILDLCYSMNTNKRKFQKDQIIRDFS